MLDFAATSLLIPCFNLRCPRIGRIPEVSNHFTDRHFVNGIDQSQCSGVSPCPEVQADTGAPAAPHNSALVVGASVLPMRHRAHREDFVGQSYPRLPRRARLAARIRRRRSQVTPDTALQTLFRSGNALLLALYDDLLLNRLLCNSPSGRAETLDAWICHPYHCSADHQF